MNKVKFSKIMLMALIICILSAAWPLQTKAVEAVSTEDEKMQTVSTSDERIKWTLSNEWIVFGDAMTYEDSFYDEWGLNKEFIDEVVIGSNDGLFAVHKYMDWYITINRELVEDVPDYASITQEQLDIMLESMEEEAEVYSDQVLLDIRQVYENETERYVIMDAYYDGSDEKGMVLYQTARGSEVITISIEGTTEFMDNQVLIHELIGDLEYDFPQVLYEDIVEENVSEFYRSMGRATGSFIVIGALIAGVIIVIIAILAIYKSGRK